MTGVQTCALDRKSTRLNSSHTIISYAVFCLKKKKIGHGITPDTWRASVAKRPTREQPRAQTTGGRGGRPTRGSSHACSRRAFFFFFNDPPTPEISPLSLPAPLPI